MNTSNYKNIIMVSSVRLSIQIYFYHSMLLKEKKKSPNGFCTKGHPNNHIL